MIQFKIKNQIFQITLINKWNKKLQPKIDITIIPNIKKINGLTKFFILDLETTGLNTQKDEIVQMSIRELIYFKRFIMKDELICNKFFFSEDIEKTKNFHGISKLDVLNNKTFEKDKESRKILKDILRKVLKEKNTYLVIQYAPFELGFIKRYFKKININALRRKVIDTRLLACYKYPNQKHDMTTISEILNINIEQNKEFHSHRADYDTLLCEECLKKFLLIL